jgi:phosphoglycolate phosphatase
MCEAYSRSYREHAAGLPPLFPGAEEVLRTLRGQGLQLAVATGKSRRGLNRELAARAMGDYFDTTRCADETRSKPHPQMLHEILGECDRGATDAVMVGDTLHDMAMARSAGVGTVAVTFGAHSGERLRAFGPDLLADDFWSILEWLNQIRV